MSPRVIILALFFAVGLLPQGWNKFDYTLHASLLYALGGLLIVLLFLSWNELGKQRFNLIQKFSALNWLKIVSIFLPIILVISFATSPIQNFGWSEVMVLSAGVGIFSIIQTFTEKERRDLLHVVLGLALACALVGFWQYLSRSETRIAGPMFDAAFKAHYWPNAFALMLLMCWPLALTVNFDYTLTTRRFAIHLAPIIKALFVGILLSALLLTFSRAAFLVLIVQAVVCLWFSRQNFFDRKKIFTAILGLLFTLILTLTLHTIRSYRDDATTNSFASKAAFSGTEQQTSFVERWNFMKGALQIISEHPLLGGGPFSFRARYAKIQPDFLAVSDHAHNWYLKIAAEEGLIALALFLALIGLVLYTRHDLLTQHGITTPIILLVALIGPLVHNLADYNMNFITNQLLFWIMLGFFVTKKKEEPNTQDMQPQNMQPQIWPFIVAIGTILISTALLFEGFNSFTKNYDQMKFVRSYFDGQARYIVSQGNTSEGIRLMRHHLSLNPYDAYSWNYLGQIQEYVDREEALKSYVNAVRHDPANVFSFYVDYVKLAQKLKKTDTETYKFYTKKALTFLKTYPEKIRANIHYTAQTDNPKQASELAKLLGENALALKIQRAIRDFRRTH